MLPFPKPWENDVFFMAINFLHVFIYLFIIIFLGDIIENPIDVFILLITKFSLNVRFQ